MGALEGMRILDMTQYEAGTSCTQALAWLGADVVKVERPGTGDPGRNSMAQEPEDSEYFINWNSNKKSITLALDTVEGRDLLLKLVPRFDVFVENFGPGVVEKLKLDYEYMKAVHPGIIYAQIKGFGTFGPYADFKCFDTVTQATAGAYSVTGEPDGPPMKPGTTTGDSGTGVQMALAICAAYVQKQRTGVGQVVELSMQEAMIYYMRTAISMGSEWGTAAAGRNGSGRTATQNIYACKPFGPNDYINMLALTSRMWRDLCLAMDREDMLTDERFESNTSRLENSEALMKEIAAWTAGHTKHEAMEILGKAGVPVGAVFDTKDLFNDPHLKERGFIHTVEHKQRGKVPIMGWGPRLSESQVDIHAAPLLGEHTDEVLEVELDMSPDQIKSLHDNKII